MQIHSAFLDGGSSLQPRALVDSVWGDYLVSFPSYPHRACMFPFLTAIRVDSLVAGFFLMMMGKKITTCAHAPPSSRVN